VSGSVAPVPAGASQDAIMRHYDLSDDFFRLWLGDELTYSCAWWEEGEGPESLAAAQARKVDYFADRLQVRGARVLDVGCGWGGLLDRFVRVHGAAGGMGITMSPAQTAFTRTRAVPGVTYELQSWVDHEPSEPYDAITCVEATEHFASDRLTPDEKVEVYREFFRRAASWLRPDGRIGLQLICLDNVGHLRSRPGRGPFTDLILEHIFPESMSAALSELVLGWETDFQLVEFHDHPEHYRRTFRAWALNHRRHEPEARALVGPDVSRTHARYFAGGEAVFRLREQTLCRVILIKRPKPKTWAVTIRPSELERVEPAPGASRGAVSSHYDVSNSFYRLWLGPTMMYSSAAWASGDELADLSTAQHRKIDFFAQRVLPSRRPARVLDVGCGWGGTLRRVADRHVIEEGVGVTLSSAQRDLLADEPVAGLDIRLEDWRDHAPAQPYDAIFCFGAFEHFAQDGSSGPERIASYRRFFRSCYGWLSPDGRLGLETIAHDDAPDTDRPRGRGPLGDFVLSLYPESLCPHLSEIVLGHEPYFEVEMLRSDADDFARTCRAWLVGLRAHRDEADRLVGAEVAGDFRRYLAASELQFRTRSITNYRLVLHRRPDLRQ
jgi:cyclopropane-fatty-acyl-phospholipid synthase